MSYTIFGPGENGCAYYLENKQWASFEDPKAAMQKDFEEVVKAFIFTTPSFKRSDGWYDNSSKILAESALFYLCQTNDRLFATISLIPKGDFPGLEKRYLKIFEKKLRNILLDHFGMIRKDNLILVDPKAII